MEILFSNNLSRIEYNLKKIKEAFDEFVQKNSQFINNYSKLKENYNNIDIKSEYKKDFENKYNNLDSLNINKLNNLKRPTLFGETNPPFMPRKKGGKL